MAIDIGSVYTIEDIEESKKMLDNRIIGLC